MDSLAQTSLWLAYDGIFASDLGGTRLDGLTLPSLTGLGTRALLPLALGTVLSSSFVSPAAANQRWGTVVYASTPSGYALNLRWGPGTNNGVHRRVRRGTTLELSGRRQNGWLQLTDATWVAGNLVSNNPVRPDFVPDQNPNQNFAVVEIPAGFGLNIRSGPGTNFARTGQFANGTRVAITGRASGNWAELSNGQWVERTFLRYGANNGGQTRPPTDPVQPTPDVEIITIQRQLKQLGFLPPNFFVSGINDFATQEALRNFQRVNGLPVTGMADFATRQALNRATQTNPIPTPTPTPTPTSPPISPPPGTGQQARVSSDGEEALVFSGPGPDFDLITTLPDGSSVTTTGNVSGNWTELSGGGWIFTPWLVFI